MTLADARGVPIAPGDTALYGFGVGRSVAMAEAVVIGVPDSRRDEAGIYPTGELRVSLTPSGRVRLRVVRRSYGGGEKPVVDVAPDRLVVLKVSPYPDDFSAPYLPPSPLPTQDEENRGRIENLIEAYTADLRATEVPDRYYYEDWTLERFHAFAASQLAKLRKELRELDD